MTDLADQLAEVLRRKADALASRSEPALRALMHPAFLYVTAAGRILDRNGYIAAYCASGPTQIRHQDAEILAVSDLGECALAALRLRDDVEIDGQPEAWSLRSFAVFRRAEAGWLWAGGQTVPAAP